MRARSKTGHGLIPETAVFRVIRYGQVVLSERRDVSDPEECKAWCVEAIGGLEEGSETEDILVFHIQDTPIAGLTRHSTLYEVGPSEAGGKGELHKLSTTRQRMGNYVTSTSPYSFEFERENVPKVNNRTLPGRSYVRKITLKDDSGAVYLKRKVRFHVIDSVKTQLKPTSRTPLSQTAEIVAKSFEDRGQTVDSQGGELFPEVDL